MSEECELLARSKWIISAIDKSSLLLAKEKVQDGACPQALGALKELAECWMAEEPPSVLQKQSRAASGNKQDYFSLGPYWWPDPEKPDGLPYIRRDGEFNPQSVSNYSDRPALEKMCIGAEILAMAGFFCTEERYLQRSLKFLQIWFLNPATRMTPHLDYGQAIPGRCDGRGIGIIDSRRLLQAINVAVVLEECGMLCGEALSEFREWIRAYLNWLQHSPNGMEEVMQHNNHGTWYDVQVAALAMYAGETDLCRKTVLQARADRLQKHVDNTGAQPHELARTRSFEYSLLNLNGFLILAELARRTGEDYWNFAPSGVCLLKNAVRFMGQYADAGKDWTYQQIAPFERWRLYPFLLEAYAKAGDVDFLEKIRLLPKDEVAADLTNLLYPAL